MTIKFPVRDYRAVVLGQARTVVAHIESGVPIPEVVREVERLEALLRKTKGAKQTNAQRKVTR